MKKILVLLVLSGLPVLSFGGIKFQSYVTTLISPDGLTSMGAPFSGFSYVTVDSIDYTVAMGKYAKSDLDYYSNTLTFFEFPLQADVLIDFWDHSLVLGVGGLYSFQAGEANWNVHRDRDKIGEIKTDMVNHKFGLNMIIGSHFSFLDVSENIRWLLQPYFSYQIIWHNLSVDPSSNSSTISTPKSMNRKYSTHWIRFGQRYQIKKWIVAWGYLVEKDWLEKKEPAKKMFSDDQSETQRPIANQTEYELGNGWVGGIYISIGLNLNLF